VAAVTLYGRRGCHLCEVAETTARRVLEGTAHSLRVVDIDDGGIGDPGLRDRYTVRVPVVTVDGVEIAQYQLDEAALRAALAG
jgi:hypothetical protein